MMNIIERRRAAKSLLKALPNTPEGIHLATTTLGNRDQVKRAITFVTQLRKMGLIEPFIVSTLGGDGSSMHIHVRAKRIG